MKEQKVFCVFSRCNMDRFRQGDAGRGTHAGRERMIYTEQVTDLDPFLNNGWCVVNAYPVITADTLSNVYFVLERDL